MRIPFGCLVTRPSPFYLYKNIHQQPDYSPVSYDVDLYPSLAAELGTGIAVTYSRRPRVPGESFLPMMVRTVGSGTNGLGFYMYHGGTTPSIGNFFMSEGFGLASKSYDYQSPIGEFGKTSSGYYPLKLINYFLQGYGDLLAPLYPVLPATNEAIKADDTTTLRYAIRSNGEGGFVFMHNFQDRISMQDHTDVHIDITTKKGNVRFPHAGTFTLKEGASGIFPFKLDFDGVFFHQATVQPFMRFKKEGHSYHVMVAREGFEPQVVLDGGLEVSGSGITKELEDGLQMVTFSSHQPSEMKAGGVTFLVLPYEMALNAYLIGSDDNQLSLISDNQTEVGVLVYPAANNIDSRTARKAPLNTALESLRGWTLSVDKQVPDMDLIASGDRHFVLRAPELDFNHINDVFLKFDYRGDRAVCMMNGELVTDHLYTSAPWLVGLKRYEEQLRQHDMYFYFIPMKKDAPYLSWLDKEVVPDFGDAREFLEVYEPEILVEYQFDIVLDAY